MPLQICLFEMGIDSELTQMGFDEAKIGIVTL